MSLIISLNLKQFNTIMNLDFSDDQKYLQEEARKFFEKEGGLGNARNVMDQSQDADHELWNKIVELGWTALLLLALLGVMAPLAPSSR